MKPIKILLILLLLVAIGIAFVSLPLRHWFMHLESYVRSLGAAGPIVVVLAYIVSTVLFIPGSAITVGAGTLFGLKTGFIVVLLGANLGALCAFFLARTLLRQRVARWAESNPRFRSLDRAIGRQ
jgi:uncharacterized membrane protein YdjX (TVP38/TMEM64 family)